METLPLTWSSVLIGFFVLVMSYSIIMGERASAKLILSVYVAIVVSEVLGGFVSTQILAGSGLLRSLFAPEVYPLFVFAMPKIGFFVLTTVVLSRIGAFGISRKERPYDFWSFCITILYGFFGAALLSSTLLKYASGEQILFFNNAAYLPNPVVSLSLNEPLIGMLTSNYLLWFSFPALLFIFLSFFVQES